MISNTASAVWAFIVGFVLASLFLPFDAWVAIEITGVIAISIGVAFTMRPRALPIAVLAALLVFVISSSAPLQSSIPAYVYWCGNPLECYRTQRVSFVKREARLYPVSDPLKWLLWNALAYRTDKVTMLEQGKPGPGQITLHAPLERTIARLNRNFDSGLLVTNKIGVSIITQVLDVQPGPGDTLKIGSDFSKTRRTILEWQTSDDVNDPGLFSALCDSENVGGCAEEAVRGDLQLRTLVSGHWVDAARAQEPGSKMTLRELVRHQMIADAILDRSIEGNVFSGQRLIALHEAMPALVRLGQVTDGRDALFSAAVIFRANTLVFPGGLPMHSPKYHDFEPEEVAWFDDDVSAFFGLLSSLQHLEIEADSPAVRARFARDKWLRELRTGSGMIALDPKKAWAIDEGSYAPFKPDYFGPEVFEAELAKAQNRAARESIIYAALKQTRESFGRTLARLDPSKRITAEEYRHTLRTTGELFDAMLKVVARHLELAGPEARVIFDYEIEGLRQTRERIAAFLLPKISERIVFGANEMDEWIVAQAIAKGTPVPWRILDHTEGCHWYDSTFRAHFVLQAESFLRTRREDQPKLFRVMIERLSHDYGENGRCPRFLPGVALLHAVSMLAGDPRANQSRRQIDDLAEADPVWLRTLYRSFGQEGLYQGRTREQRLLDARR